MEFVHRPYQPGETIAAVATPQGEGGVAIVRISGTGALDIAAKLFSSRVHTFASHTAHFGKIRDGSGAVLDEALLLVMRAPRSYTGEDTVEIHCHGGTLVTRTVLEAALSAGARAALPGEFTFRAFINGKIDLAQAEAVQELICARNDFALHAAEQQLQGRLSKEIQEIQKSLVDSAAILEAWVDFPEEGLEFATMEEIIADLVEAKEKIEALCDTFLEGKIVSHGISLCLSGAPNVGKSSLMNALLGKDRAIVTDIPGTTRDLLEEEMRLGALHFRLIDTAGIRETEEVIEQEGIRRSRNAFASADLILLILDASRPVSVEELQIVESIPQDKTLLLWNKIDIASPHQPCPVSFPHTVAISAKTGSGLSLLKEKISEMVWKRGVPSKEEVYITSARHKQALDQALLACEDVIAGLQNGVSPEFLSADMRKALLELGTIIGTNVTEDILGAIFSKFCIGK